MIATRRVMGLLVGLGLWLGMGEVGVTAPKSNGSMLHRPAASSASQAFQQVAQPPGIKLGVTAAGIGLIGLELWWFLGSKPKAPKARSPQNLLKPTALEQHLGQQKDNVNL